MIKKEKNKNKIMKPLLDSLCSICQNTTLEAKTHAVHHCVNIGVTMPSHCTRLVLEQMKLSCLNVIGEG